MINGGTPISRNRDTRNKNSNPMRVWFISQLTSMMFFHDRVLTHLNLNYIPINLIFSHDFPIKQRSFFYKGTVRGAAGGPDHPLRRKDRRTPAMAREAPWRFAFWSREVLRLSSGKLFNGLV